MKNHRFPLHVLSLAVACAIVPVAASAQSPATDLDEVLVTATRTSIALADSLLPAQVITREEIERTQARTLPDLLRGRAGIDIGNQGGPGKLSTVFLRGSESDHVLVLVDGVRVGSATSGQVAFQDLPVDQIDRIEIVRGPRSSLYGSEAIGGVIQIFTRRDRGAITPRFRVGIGSNSLREASAGIGGGGARGWFGADVAYQRTDGINACSGSGTLFRGCFVDEPDRDGYRNASVSLRGGVDISDSLKLEATALRAESDNEFDGSRFGGNEAENVQQATGGKLAWAAAPAIDLTVQAGRAYDRSSNFFSGAAMPRAPVGIFDTRRDTAAVQADIGLSTAHLLTLGIDWQQDAIESDTAFKVDDRDNLGVFVQYQGRFGAQQLQASVRHDDNQQFSERTTGGLGWGLALDDGYRLTANAATGFKAPSFNDLYFPFFGNPDLAPERSRSVTFGVARDANAHRWTFDVYDTRVDDLITFDAAISLPNNVDEARIRGAELTFHTRIADWDLSTQLSHTDPRNRTDGGNRGNQLARRARNTGRVDLDRAFGAYRFGVTVVGAGARFDDAANTVRLGGFATTDLRLEYAAATDWTLQARVTNAFDRTYQTVDWYNQPGREYGLALRYAPSGAR